MVVLHAAPGDAAHGAGFDTGRSRPLPGIRRGVPRAPVDGRLQPASA